MKKRSSMGMPRAKHSKSGRDSDYKIRKATLDDVRPIYQLIGQFANKKEDFLLPRSLTNIYESIRDFFVCESRGKKIVGCVALHVLWDGLAETKALAVNPRYQRKNIGRRLLEACLDEAIMMRISRVFALTVKPEFFIKQGFKVIDKSGLPQKIWNECINCPYFPDCDEVAVMIEL
jgi:amino-acid N-acetyltransferase